MAVIMLTPRARTRVLFLLLIIVIIGFALHPSSPAGGVDTAGTLLARPTTTQHIGQAALDRAEIDRSSWSASQHNFTIIHAHAPGFTVFENLYYRNKTYYILTPTPWSMPEKDLVASRGWRDLPDLAPKEVVQLLAVRDPSLGKLDKNKEAQLPGRTVSFDEAREMAASAIELEGPMFLNNDDNFVAHYYHWIGEMFLGSWRLWKHWEWLVGRPVPDPKTIAFARVYDMEHLPWDLDDQWTWEDPAGANRFFMNTLFPGAKIESRLEWDRRDATNNLYRIPLVLLGDRGAGHLSPGANFKPFSDVLRLPVPTDYLLELRDRILADYSGPVQMKTARKRPRIVYLQRQKTTRRLTHDAHLQLVAALEDLAAEVVADFEMVEFTGAMPWADQVAHMTNVDFLVAVHGNGLTHSLWMTPGRGRTVFEMIPRGCSMNDYSPLAHAAHLDHFLVRETSMCNYRECPSRGCHYAGTKAEQLRGPNRDDITVDPELITETIRQQVEEHWSGSSRAGAAH